MVVSSPSGPAEVALPRDRAFSVSMHVREHRYGDSTLFSALDLNLPAAEICCLLGPSGVGKSTLLRLLAGLLPSAAGERITCSDGMALTGRLAYMDQRDLLYPWLSVLDNICLGARLRGEAADLERAHGLLEAVGLGQAGGHYPRVLSGGMRQRAALARTLMEDRPLVLMDEPFSALDAVSRYHLQALAAALLRGHTVLLVTHDPLEALRIGHQALVLSGTPATLSEPMRIPGLPPRTIPNPELVALQAELMARLGMRQ